MDYALIVLLYARDKLASTARIARQLQSRMQPAKVLVVINGTAVDPATARRQFRFAQDLEILVHDNSGQEFGGYQAAIDSMQGTVPDRLIVMNDTAGSHGVLTPTFLAAFRRQLSDDIRCFAMGTIDWDPRVLELQGLRSARWIRTHLFAIDRAALELLGNRLYHPEIDQLITASPDLEEFFGSRIRGTLRSHLQHFLFTPSSHSWYGAAPLGKVNCNSMAGKARAILQEKYLCMKLEAADVPICQIYLGRGERLRDYAEKYVLTLRRFAENAWSK